MKELKEVISRYYPLSESDWTLFFSVFQETNLKKDETFTREGNVEDRIGFVISGALRSFFFNNGSEITNDIFIEGNFVSVMDSYITKRPSDSTIIAVQDSRLVFVSRNDLTSLFEKSPEAEAMMRVVLETVYHRKRELEVLLRIAMASEKLDFFYNYYKDCFNIFSQKVIASFLNVTPETLSRLIKK